MAYGYFKDFNRRTAADKVLQYKTINIAKNQKQYGYQRGLASMVYNFFDEKTSGGAIENGIMSNKAIAEKLHKPFIRKFDKRKVHSSFISNIWDDSDK